MTEDEHKKAITDALKKLRDDIEAVQGACAETITPHLKALGFEFEDAGDYDVYEAIERVTLLDTENFFSSVSCTIDALCEAILWNNG